MKSVLFYQEINPFVSIAPSMNHQWENGGIAAELFEIKDNVAAAVHLLSKEISQDQLLISIWFHVIFRVLEIRHEGQSFSFPKMGWKNVCYLKDNCYDCCSWFISLERRKTIMCNKYEHQKKVSLLVVFAAWEGKASNQFSPSGSERFTNCPFVHFGFSVELKRLTFINCSVTDPTNLWHPLQYLLVDVPLGAGRLVRGEPCRADNVSRVELAHGVSLLVERSSPEHGVLQIRTVNVEHRSLCKNSSKE